MATRRPALRLQWALLGFVTLVVVQRTAAQNMQAAPDQKRLQGIWRVREVVGDIGGKIQTFSLPMHFVFEGNTIVILFSDDPQGELSYSLDPSKSPKRIDVLRTVSQPKLAGQKPPTPEQSKILGIYAFEKGWLKLRFDEKRAGRPVDFSVKADPSVTVLTLEPDASPNTRLKVQDARQILAIRQLGAEVFSDSKPGIGENLYVKLNVTQGDVLLAKLAPHLKSLSRITSLHLNGTKVTDVGLAALEGIDNIEHINLEGTALTDAGLTHLKKMTHLRQLSATDTQVSRAGITALLQSLPQLHVAHLSRVESAQKAITKAGGVLYSDAQGKFTEVRFTQGNLKDAALHDLQKHLEVLKGTLRDIDFTNCPITDQGLESLVGMTELRQLTLTGTNVTVAGVKSLQRVVPELKVKH